MSRDGKTADFKIVDAERVAIIGSRDWTDRKAVAWFVDSLPVYTIIVSGGARGVDGFAEIAARARGMRVVIYPADWQKHGKRAGFLRNATIVENCDRVVAFWDGESRGTKSTIDLARKAGKPVEVIRG